MSGATVRCKFPIRRRDTSAHDKTSVGETVVERLRPIQPTKPRVSRVARQLALAHCIERYIEQGELRDLADAARALGITRARVTQIASLPLLAPEIQERLLAGDWPIPARRLRCVVSEAEWEAQRALVSPGTSSTSRPDRR